MARRRTVPRVKIAPRVTRKDGEVFAEAFLDRAWDTSSGFEAFADTKLVRWPAGFMGDPRQGRYLDIEDEVIERTFAALRPAVAEAFVKAAQRVLARERRRQK